MSIHTTNKIQFHCGPYSDYEYEYLLTDPVYPNGSFPDAETTIKVIQDVFLEYGEDKFVNFVGLEINELEKVKKAFPNHDIWNVGDEGYPPYYHVRPLKYFFK